MARASDRAVSRIKGIADAWGREFYNEKLSDWQRFSAYFASCIALRCAEIVEEEADGNHLVRRVRR